MTNQTTASGAPNAPASTVPLCTKCGQNPRADADGSNPWCKTCRAEYQRTYENNRLARKESRGYALGVQAMREGLAKQFDALGFSNFEAREIRDLILQFPAPAIPPE